MHRAPVLLVIILGIVLVAPATEAGQFAYDFTATYQIDASGAPTSFTLVGNYSKTIDCQTSWTLSNLVAGPTPNQNRQFVIQAAYAAGALAITETQNGQFTEHTFRCALFTLPPIPDEDELTPGEPSELLPPMTMSSSSPGDPVTGNPLPKCKGRKDSWSGMAPINASYTNTIHVFEPEVAYCIFGAAPDYANAIPYTGRVYLEATDAAGEKYIVLTTKCKDVMSSRAGYLLAGVCWKNLVPPPESDQTNGFMAGFHTWRVEAQNLTIRASGADYLFLTLGTFGAFVDAG